MKTLRYVYAALLSLVSGLFATPALAGTTGTEFGGLYNLMVGWTNGFLGRSIAIIAFLFGAGIGVARQSIVPAILGIVFAIVFSVGPGVITGMLSATI